MKLKEFLNTHMSQNAFALRMGVSQGLVWQWANGKVGVPPLRAAQIEKITYGAVTRRELRPDDWFLIWPELLSRESSDADV